MSTSNALAKTDQTSGLDPKAGARAIESIVVRGDLSALNPAERARYYVLMCEGLGLNPHAHPFAFLRLNGKEILYATRGATDQLASMHRLNREIVDGPKVIDLAGAKLVYAVCRASHPNGRIETAVATVPLTDPVNVLMKCETKAKRRATLSILGLGLLDESEIETIPASAKEMTAQVDGALLQAAIESGAVIPPPRAEARVEPPPPVDDEIPEALLPFLDVVADVELPGESVSVWMKYRSELGALPTGVREFAWKALCRRTEEVGKMKNAKVWLKKAIAEEDARRGLNAAPPVETAEQPSPEFFGEPPAEAAPPPAEDNDLQDGEEEGASSRAFAGYVEAIPVAANLETVHNLYVGLVQDLHEEGHPDPMHFLGGEDGALAKAYARTRELGHRISKAEMQQLLRSRPLAQLLDTQDGINPGQNAVAPAARWWLAHKGDLTMLDPAHRDTPRYALVRRYSGAQDAQSTKRAGIALEEMVKLLQSRPTPPDGTSGGGPRAPGSASAQGGGAAAAGSGAPRAMLEDYTRHLDGIPDRGQDRGTGRVAGSFWKRREDFTELGVRAEALGLVVDELTRRGVEEPHTWLEEIGERNGYVQRQAAA